MTNENSLDLTQKYDQGKLDFKPTGLYYSIGHAWREWCESEMPEWVKPWNFYLYMNNSKILLITNTHQLREFCDKYMKKFFKYTYLIDWHEVSKSYSGIEFQRYNNLKYMSNRGDDYAKYLWLYGWDVSGGCIWDLDVIKNVRRYAANS